MPIYEHQCETCEYVWEDYFSSYKSPVPNECPKCHSNKIIRLISWCRGKVELSGKELIQSLKNQGKQLSNQAKSNEKLTADIVGEDKYHKNLLTR